MDEIKHLPAEKLAQRRPPPEIEFRGFKVVEYSGMSYGVLIQFKYGEKYNTSVLTDVELKRFKEMSESERKEFIYQIGVREWNALEELRLIQDECANLEAELHSMSSKWVGTDLLSK